MASNLSCIGLAVESSDELGVLLQRIRPEAMQQWAGGGLEVYRWQDPSGARLTLAVRDGELVDLLPSLETVAGIRLQNCHALNDETMAGDVVDVRGELTTRLTFELEQRRALGRDASWSGIASLVAFATDVDFFVDAAAFTASPRSLLDPHADPNEPPPAAWAQRGIAWPPRVAAESFISYGIMSSEAPATADARLSGIVMTSEVRRNALTGQSFCVSRVRCLGFEAEVVSPPPAVLPVAGGVVSGTVFLVASVDELWARGPELPPG